jgi:hypothetical protein
MSEESVALLPNSKIALQGRLKTGHLTWKWPVLIVFARLIFAIVAQLLVAGIFMLKGRGWARITLIIWVSSVLIITFIVVGLSTQLYAKSIVSIFLILPLFHSGPNKYFKGN